MKATFGLVRGAVLAAALTALIAGCARAGGPFPDPPGVKVPAELSSGPQTVVLAGGCFWGMEGLFERVKGVVNVVSGYSGGSAATAHYEVVSSGTTGHAESIEITYDPSVVGLGTLLKIFFSIAENPTELNFQGPDYGTQYRSVVFYQNEYQKELTDRYIKEIERAKYFSSPIVTQVVPFKAFYPAEAYHQHFLDKHPEDPYIVMWDLPKIRDLERTYPDLVAGRFQPDPVFEADTDGGLRRM